MTRKQYLRILIALIDVDGLGIAAKGQGTDKIVVNIPYEFVVVENTYGRHIWSESWNRYTVTDFICQLRRRARN